VTRTASAVLAAGLVLALAPASAAARGFGLGVTSAEVSTTSALLWTRADKAGPVTLQVSPSRRFSGAGVVVRRARATKANDNTVQIRVTGLKPGHRFFYYRFVQGANTSAVGRFVTAPLPTQAKTITFAYTGDADAQKAPGQTKPFYNDFEIYGRMAREGNDFNINFGDTIYSDTEVPGGPPPALSVAAKWGKYRQNLALKNLQTVRASTGMYNHWDDHEFVNDFSVAENGRGLYNNGVRAFRNYMPVTYRGSTGIYRTFRWGRNVELFFLDERSFRSAKASANHVCNNPQTGSPDLGPTAPPRLRNTFALIVPSFSAPVSQQCLDTIRSPQRTFLGASQYARFTAALKASKAKFKIIMNEDPIQQFYALPYDRWEGYEAERQKLLRYIQANVKNVVFLTTDTHANLYNDARLATFPEEGGPLDTGINELVTGPAATMTFTKEIDATTGRQGAGDLVTSVFFKPPPPNGVGMRCAATDVFSYTQVKVTATAVTLTPKDLNGKPVHEKGQNGAQGPQCGPFTIAAK
jgi:phosphodiesterase/alkaline phosphatase D-like protein